MLRTIKIFAPFLLLPFFTQCGFRSAPDSEAVTGPFDSRGNYVEDWVDKPEKWYRPSKQQKSKKKTVVAEKKKPKPMPQLAEVHYDHSITAKPKPTIVEPTVVPKPKPVTITPKPKPKPKLKPKPKPKSVTHKVVRGDTLYGLARKYGVSVSKIRSANNIKGDIIRLGQLLKIPK